MSAWVWIGVAVLGALGSVARFLLHSVLAARSGGFPLGTLAVNASGTLLLGLLDGLGAGGEGLLLAGSAALGSYTTFSTWMFETERLAGEGAPAIAAVNIVLSLAVGIGAAALGRAIGLGL